MARVQARTEAALDRLLPPAAIAPQRLHEAMRYAVLGGGKRIRPLLVFAAGEAGAVPGADPARLEYNLRGGRVRLISSLGKPNRSGLFES